MTAIAACLRDLLYQYEIVVIPDLGGFVTNYKPASIDYAHGKMYPPSKLVSFNDNLMANDGLLVDYLRKKENISMEKAQEMIENFVKEIKSSVKSGTSFAIKDIGKLYIDGSNQILLMPADVNFDTNAFGLPIINYSPITRARENGSSTTPKIMETKMQKSMWKRLAPYIPLLFILFGLLVVAFVSLNKKNKAAVPTIPHKTMPPADTTNPVADITPAASESTTPNNSSSSAPEVIHPKESKVSAELSPKEQENYVPSSVVVEEEHINVSPSTTTTTTTIKKRTSVAIIGSFADDVNRSKLKQKIQKDGFSTYSDMNNNMYRLGVKFSYSTEKEKQRLLTTIRNKYNPQAWVLSK